MNGPQNYCRGMRLMRSQSRPPSIYLKPQIHTKTTFHILFFLTLLLFLKKQRLFSVIFCLAMVRGREGITAMLRFWQSTWFDKSSNTITFFTILYMHIRVLLLSRLEPLWFSLLYYGPCRRLQLPPPGAKSLPPLRVEKWKIKTWQLERGERKNRVMNEVQWI